MLEMCCVACAFSVRALNRRHLSSPLLRYTVRGDTTLVWEAFYALRMSLDSDRLVGLEVKTSTSGAEDPRFECRLRRDSSWSSHTSDFKIGTPVATLSGAWHYRVSAGTGRPGVSVL